MRVQTCQMNILSSDISMGRVGLQRDQLPVSGRARAIQIEL
jgi:hypothetical protein